MRVLITAPWAERLGGAEAMLQTVLESARESGHELEFVFMQNGPWPRELQDAGFRVEVIEAGRLRDIHRWVATVVKLASVMRRRRPDLILNWAAKMHLYGAPAAMLVGMSERVLWWQQGIPTGNWIDRCATALPARAVGCYSQAAADAQARLWPTRRTFVVAAGAPIPDSSSGLNGSDASAARERRERRPVVGLVGRLQPWKGQDRLLRAQAMLRARGYDMHALIVGGDAYRLSPEYAAALPDLVSELGLEDAVTLTDQVPDAGPYIDDMDVLVNASDPEPFGIVLLEAMARGVAVVAVDSGGPAEFIEHGKTGLLASSGEPEALADAIEPLLDSPSLRRTLGDAGRERFLRDFTAAALGKRFYASLEQLAEPAARSPADEVTIVAHDVGSVGGMERQLAELILGLRAQGVDVTVIARTCVLPPDSGVTFHRVRGPGRPFILAYPWFLIAGSLALRRRRRGLVQATGAIVFGKVDSIAVHCCQQAYESPSTRGGIRYQLYSHAVRHLARVGERVVLGLSRSARLICVSEGVAQEMRRHFPAAAERVVTIHNGVDSAAFAPGLRGREAAEMRADLALRPDRLIAAFIGDANKGLCHVLEALARVEGWELVVAGRGHVGRCQELAQALGVADRVHWLGVVQDIQRVYELADAFVLPSGYETFSLVTFEAAASGLAILATPVSGVRELIDDGQSGFLIAPDPDAIAARLDQLAADPELRSRLGSAARQAAQRFTWSRMVQRHRELYDELAASR